MPDLTPLYTLLSHVIPLDCMQARFMQQAMLGLLLLAPMCAAMGVQVVNLRMAFFSDAISHSAFVGVALGLLLGVNAHLAMAGFALLVGVGIVAAARRTSLSSDTVIGVFFSAAVAFGLAVVSRDRNAARNVQAFLYGDILTISNTEIWCLIALFVALLVFQWVGFNRLLFIGLNASLAEAHAVRVRFWQYLFAALLSLVVMFAVWAVGVLLVTALLIVPAAAARNLARTAGAMFWWALGISWIAAVAGLLISAQPWARTATGATVVLVASFCFALSLIAKRR
ncbi:TPA: ABC transporter [Candidatus Sumerlaeota bacterium]|nr:ABC transporter [Candidatus Sumerlaeota bacterium]